MVSIMKNGNLFVDPGAGLDSFAKFLQNGVNRATAGYQNSSSAFKISFGDLGTNDTVIINATGGKYKGFNTDTAPAAGFIGEEIRSAVAVGSAVALTTTVNANITSISLTAGIWDVSAIGGFSGTPTVNLAFAASISQVSATGGTDGDNAVKSSVGPIAGSNQCIVVPSYRIRVNGTTPVYLVLLAVFDFGACSGYGRISAVRVS